MIKIEDYAFPSNKQWELAIRGMRNPMNSWDKSDSGICDGPYAYEDGAEEKGWCAGCGHYNLFPYTTDGSEVFTCDEPGSLNIFRIGKNDMSLAKKLCGRGPEHRKFLRQLPVTLEINAPLYWWRQMDKYQIGTATDSCSTMHKLGEKKFTEDDFSFDYCDDDYDKEFIVSEMIDWLNLNRDYWLTMDNAYRKKYWHKLVEFLPQSYNQKRVWSGNYEVLRTICRQREGHKLDEWRDFIEWVRENVPYAKELIFEEKMAKRDQMLSDIGFTQEGIDQILKMSSLECVEEHDVKSGHCLYFITENMPDGIHKIIVEVKNREKGKADVQIWLKVELYKSSHATTYMKLEDYYYKFFKVKETK